MVTAIERMSREIVRGMIPLVMNHQRMDKMLALQKKKELGKRELDDCNLAKLKGWAHRADVTDLQAFWRNAVTSHGWTKGKAYLLKTTRMWSRSLGHAIDSSIYEGKKHME